MKAEDQTPTKRFRLTLHIATDKGVKEEFLGNFETPMEASIEAVRGSFRREDVIGVSIDEIKLDLSGI